MNTVKTELQVKWAEIQFTCSKLMPFGVSIETTISIDAKQLKCKPFNCHLSSQNGMWMKFNIHLWYVDTPQTLKMASRMEGFQKKCGVPTYDKWNFKSQISSIFYFDWVSGGWNSSHIGCFHPCPQNF